MDSAFRTRLVLIAVIGASLGFLAWTLAPLIGTSPSETPGTATRGPDLPSGSTLVNINMTGFEPSSIEAKAGEPLKLAFYRGNDTQCTREVVFPDLGIRREIPPFQTVVVEVTPAKTGTLAFACGMNMLKGKVIVR